jgi:hypothetical protein
MKKAIATLMLLTGGLFAAPAVNVEIGIGFGAPAPVAIVQPAMPAPGYVWVNGFYQPNGVWIAGYWAPPVPVAVVREAPRVDVNRYNGDRDGHARVIEHPADNRGADQFRR